MIWLRHKELTSMTAWVARIREGSQDLARMVWIQLLCPLGLHQATLPVPKTILGRHHCRLSDAFIILAYNASILPTDPMWFTPHPSCYHSVFFDSVYLWIDGEEPSMVLTLPTVKAQWWWPKMLDARGCIKMSASFCSHAFITLFHTGLLVMDTSVPCSTCSTMTSPSHWCDGAMFRMLNGSELHICCFFCFLVYMGRDWYLKNPWK